jgi:hypothetical protein
MWESNIPIWKDQPPVIGRGIGSSTKRIGGFTTHEEGGCIPEPLPNPNVTISPFGIFGYGRGMLVIDLWKMFFVVLLLLAVAAVGYLIYNNYIATEYIMHHLRAMETPGAK